MEINKEFLYKMYIDNNKSIREIKNILNEQGIVISCKRISAILKEFNIVKTKDLIREQRHNTNLEKYGTIHPFQNKDIKAKTEKTNIERYGSRSPFGNKEVQDKSKQTSLAKYGTEIPILSDYVRKKIQATNLDLYGSVTPLGNKEIQDKIKAKLSQGTIQAKRNCTMHNNNSFGKSKDEEQIYETLLTRFNKEDIIRQYCSEQYPYPCDFYIKSLDLYIEYQGSWVHGNEPFDPTNELHQIELDRLANNKTDYYNYVIKIWTERDPYKRELAKTHNLNWIEFFNIEEFTKWFNNCGNN